MASASFDPSSNEFHIRFRFASQAFKRSLKTENAKEAKAALARVEETLSLLQRGVQELSANADPATFLLSAGNTKQPPQKAEKVLTLGQLIDSYLKSLPEQAEEKTTLKTEATHIKHFRARLPMNKPIESLTTNDIQQFINLESRRKVSAKFLSPDTIKRHMDTLKCILNWAVTVCVLKGTLSISLQARDLRTHVAATTTIPGQLFDWGKSNRCLEHLFSDMSSYLGLPSKYDQPRAA